MKPPIHFSIFGQLGLQMYPNKWIDVSAEECSGAGECEKAIFGQVQVVHWSGDWWRNLRMSSNFIVIFPDQRKFEAPSKPSMSSRRMGFVAISARLI